MQGVGTLLVTPRELAPVLVGMSGNGLLQATPAGDTALVGMHGSGSLLATPGELNTAVVGMYGTSVLYAMRLKNSTPVDVSGEGALLVSTTTIAGGSVWIPSLLSKGAEQNYAEAIQFVQPLYSSGNDDYIPAKPGAGMAWIPNIVSWGYAAGASGEGEAFVPALQSRAGDYNYSIGEAYVPALLSWGTWVEPGYFFLYSMMGMRSGILGVGDMVVALNNTGQIVDTITADRQYIAEMIEAAEASGTITVAGQFLFTYDSPMAAQGSIDANLEFTEQLTEAMTAEGSLTALGDYLAACEVTAAVDGTIDIDLRYLAELVESAILDGSLDAVGEYFASVSGSATIQFSSAGLSPGVVNTDNTSRVWVVNMETAASSQYDGYGFNSFFERDGEYYGVAEDGIYKLDGDDDVGNSIDAVLETGRSDLGTSHKKTQVKVYAGVSSEGKVLLKVDADGQSYIYEARSSSTDMTNTRFDVGRGLKGNYYNFTLLNQNGDDFELETITFEPVVLSRKI